MFLITGCNTTCCLNRLGKKTAYTTLLKNLNSGTNNLSDLQYFREADDTVCVSVAARGEGEWGHAPRAALSRGLHFKEDKNSSCVRSFKCFTARDIRPPEVLWHLKCTKFTFDQLRPRPMPGSSPESLDAWLGEGQGGAARPTFVPGATDLCAANAVFHWQESSYSCMERREGCKLIEWPQIHVSFQFFCDHNRQPSSFFPSPNRWWFQTTCSPILVQDMVWKPRC